MDKSYLNMIDKYFFTLENIGQIDQNLKHLLFVNVVLSKIKEKYFDILTEEQKNIIKSYNTCLENTPCFGEYLADGCN